MLQIFKRSLSSIHNIIGKKTVEYVDTLNNQITDPTTALLSHGITKKNYLAQGGESQVYALNDQYILRLCKIPHAFKNDLQAGIAYVIKKYEKRASLYVELNTFTLPYAVPIIKEIGVKAEIPYTIIKKRLS
jgi:hypothetical protein